MAMSKMPSLSAMHLRYSLNYLTLRLKSDNTVSTPTSSKQSQETRPQLPQKPKMRFINDRKSKIVSELHKEGAKRWKELGEEAKRPYVERYENAKRSWLAEKAQMEAQFEAIEDKRDEVNREPLPWFSSKYNGYTLFYTELQIQMQFRIQFMADELKEADKELNREWSELSDEEREKYVEPFEVETVLYNAQMNECRAENKRNRKVGKVKNRKMSIHQMADIWATILSLPHEDE